MQIKIKALVLHLKNKLENVSHMESKLKEFCFEEKIFPKLNQSCPVLF